MSSRKFFLIFLFLFSFNIFRHLYFNLWFMKKINYFFLFISLQVSELWFLFKCYCNSCGYISAKCYKFQNYVSFKFICVEKIRHDKNLCMINFSLTNNFRFLCLLLRRQKFVQTNKLPDLVFFLFVLLVYEIIEII